MEVAAYGELNGCSYRLVSNSSVVFSTIPPVVLLDYNSSTVYSCTLMGKHPFEKLVRPVNPMGFC